MSANHCDECGAYLATDADIAKHTNWHEEITDTIEALREAIRRPRLPEVYG